MAHHQYALRSRSSPGNAGLNAMTFDAAGNFYVSNSIQGIIWRRKPPPDSTICGVAEAWVTSDLLKPNGGIPPFGANGLGFNKAGDALFVANTAMDWIVKISGHWRNTGDAGGVHEQHQRCRRARSRQRR